MPRSITVITDCYDENARGRQIARYASLFPGVHIELIGTNHDIQAGGLLMDVLDGLLSDNNIIIVNIAPRHGKAKKWKNGTPFGYTNIGGNTVISSVDGYALSFLKKLGLLQDFSLFDIPTVLQAARESGLITAEDEHSITHTQFRSFEFLPRVAYWLSKGSFAVPTTEYDIAGVADLPDQIWNIDNFGNCKTTIFGGESAQKKWIDPAIQALPRKSHLHELESGECALVVGSSGYRNRRCIEIIRNGKNAALEYGYQVGSEV